MRNIKSLLSLKCKLVLDADFSNLKDVIKKAKGNYFFLQFVYRQNFGIFIFTPHKKSYKSIAIKLTATKSVIMFLSESRFKTSRFITEDSNMNYY